MTALMSCSWCSLSIPRFAGGSFPRGLDVARLDHFAHLIAPAVAFERDHRGDVRIGELLAERRHSGALLAVEDDLDVSALRLLDERGAIQAGEGALHPLPVRLVAGDAVCRIDLLAARFQVGEIPF